MSAFTKRICLSIFSVWYSRSKYSTYSARNVESVDVKSTEVDSKDITIDSEDKTVDSDKIVDLEDEAEFNTSWIIICICYLIVDNIISIIACINYCIWFWIKLIWFWLYCYCCELLEINWLSRSIKALNIAASFWL